MKRAMRIPAIQWEDSAVDLQAAINRFIAEHNQTSKPFVRRSVPIPSSQLETDGSKRWSQSTRFTTR